MLSFSQLISINKAAQVFSRAEEAMPYKRAAPQSSNHVLTNICAT